MISTHTVGSAAKNKSVSIIVVPNALLNRYDEVLSITSNRSRGEALIKSGYVEADHGGNDKQGYRDGCTIGHI